MKIKNLTLRTQDNCIKTMGVFKFKIYVYKHTKESSIEKTMSDVLSYPKGFISDFSQDIMFFFRSNPIKINVIP